MELPAAFARYRGALDETLRSLLGSACPRAAARELHRMLRYHLGWEDAEGRPLRGDGGKALRPTLCLLACEAAGGDWRRRSPPRPPSSWCTTSRWSTTISRTATPSARHRPTVWAVWGEAQAINAGDALLALARLAAAASCSRRACPPERVRRGGRASSTSARWRWSRAR